MTTELASVPAARVQILARAMLAYRSAYIGPENFQGLETYAIGNQELMVFQGEGGRRIPGEWKEKGITIFARYNHAPGALRCIEYIPMPGMASVEDLKRYLAECASINGSQ